MSRDSSESSFDAFVRDLDPALLIVTAVSGEERAGCLVGFATQASIDPPRFLVCVSKRNRTHAIALSADSVAVHLVPADRMDLAELFGGETGDALDKFARCAWHPGPRDVPILDDCPSWFAGAIVERFELGDHDALLLEPIAVEHQDSASPLRTRRGARIDPGHEA